METLCTYCGSPLAGDDARYCRHCGMLVPSHPFSSKSLSSSPANAPQGNAPRPVVREQIAQQPPSRGAGRTTQDDPPPWISQLDTGSLSSGKRETAGWSQSPAQIDFPPPQPVPPLQRGNTPDRPLHVKVWNTTEASTDTPSLEQADENASDDDGVETLPTRPLASSTPTSPRADNAAPPAARPARDAHADDVEQLDTVPLATPSLARQTPWPSVSDLAQPRPRAPQRNLFADEARASNPASPFPSTAPAAPGRSEQQPRAVSQSASQPGLARQVTASPRPKRGQRKRLPVITLLVLVVLIIAGAVAFVVVKQPFSVAEITQPQLTYSNAQSGFSVQYPNGWVAGVDAGKATVSFYDTSRTDQFIVHTASNASNVSQYLQQEASKLGMTSQQTGLSAMSFGGASWQQLKGSVLVGGASYTETLLATSRGKSLFVIMQLAPQATYNKEDQLVFSLIRSSFQFLS